MCMSAHSHVQINMNHTFSHSTPARLTRNYFAVIRIVVAFDLFVFDNGRDGLVLVGRLVKTTKDHGWLPFASTSNMPNYSAMVLQRESSLFLFLRLLDLVLFLFTTAFVARSQGVDSTNGTSTIVAMSVVTVRSLKASLTTVGENLTASVGYSLNLNLTVFRRYFLVIGKNKKLPPKKIFSRTPTTHNKTRERSLYDHGNNKPSGRRNIIKIQTYKAATSHPSVSIKVFSRHALAGGIEKWKDLQWNLVVGRFVHVPNSNRRGTAQSITAIHQVASSKKPRRQRRRRQRGADNIIIINNNTSTTLPLDANTRINDPVHSFPRSRRLGSRRQGRHSTRTRGRRQVQAGSSESTTQSTSLIDVASPAFVLLLLLLLLLVDH